MTMIGSQPLPASAAHDRGAVVDMAWAIRGGSVRLSIHAAEPFGEYDTQQLAEVIRRVEALVHTLDATLDYAPRHPTTEPAGSAE